MPNIPMLKSTISAVVVASVSKFYTGHNTKDAIVSGLVNMGSVAITDALFSMSSMLPAWFAKLGYYGQDIASSLINVALIWGLNKLNLKSVNFVTNGGPFMDFLISLGAAVVASYAVAPIRQMLPGAAGIV